MFFTFLVCLRFKLKFFNPEHRVLMVLLWFRNATLKINGHLKHVHCTLYSTLNGKIGENLASLSLYSFCPQMFYKKCLEGGGSLKNYK